MSRYPLFFSLYRVFLRLRFPVGQGRGVRDSTAIITGKEIRATQVRRAATSGSNLPPGLEDAGESASPLNWLGIDDGKTGLIGPFE